MSGIGASSSAAPSFSTSPPRPTAPAPTTSRRVPATTTAGASSFVSGTSAVAGRSTTSMRISPIRGASTGTTRRTSITTQPGGTPSSLGAARRVRRGVGEKESELRVDENGEGEARKGRRFHLPSETEPPDHTEKWIALAKRTTGDAALLVAMDRSMVEDVCEKLKKVAASLEEDKWMYE